MGRDFRGYLLALALGFGTGFALAAAATAAVNTDRVNVRARPSLFSEVVTQLRQEETVTVLEVSLRGAPGADPRLPHCHLLLVV